MPFRKRFRNEAQLACISHARSVLLALALGLMTTWLTTWGLALHFAHSIWATGASRGFFPRHQIRTSDGDIGLESSRLFGYRDVTACPRWTSQNAQFPFDEYYPTPDRVELSERKALGEPPWTVPSWVTLPTVDDSTLIWNSAHASGWPALAGFWVQETRRTPPGSPRSFAVSNRFGTPLRIPGTTTWEGIVPLRPIPLGIVLNTLSYGACWWLAFAGIQRVRTICRRNRGGCPHCYYDLRGLAPGAICPECGTPQTLELNTRASARASL